MSVNLSFHLVLPLFFIGVGWGWVSISSYAVGSMYSFNIFLMEENQLLSEMSFTANCRLAIWFSIQVWSLKMLPNRLSMFFSIQTVTGSIPNKANAAVSETLFGRDCSCFRHLFWKASSSCVFLFMRLLQPINQSRDDIFSPHVCF